LHPWCPDSGTGNRSPVLGAEQTSGNHLTPGRCNIAQVELVAGLAAIDPADPKELGSLEFAIIVDIDMYEDRLLLVGANRDPHGKLSPDGAIAWAGSLKQGFKDHPAVYYSSDGPGAASMGKCHIFETAKVRFLGDGSFVIIPGVEPGIYLYRPDGTLARVWQTDVLGVESSCDMPVEVANRLSREFESRWAWLNQRRLIDEVLPIWDDIGLIIRSVEKGKTSWQITLLDRDGDGDARDIKLPVTSPSVYSHARADMRHDTMALLILESGRLEEPPAAPPRLLILDLSNKPAP
jgi:hypothetical protein